MKSRLIKLLIPVTMMFFLASCGINKVNVDALKKTKRVALVSIMTENKIDTSKVDEGNLLAMASNLVPTKGSKDILMNDKVAGLKSYSMKNSSKIFGFRMVSEKCVISRKSYKAINDSSKDLANLVAPHGYKRIFSNEKKVLADALKGLKNVDAAMIVMLKMRLVKGAGALGVGKAYLWADMTFYLVDKQGNLILHRTASQESDTSTLRVMGVFKNKDLKKMSLEAVKKDLDDIAKWIQEEMKKSVKKA